MMVLFRYFTLLPLPVLHKYIYQKFKKLTVIFSGHFSLDGHYLLMFFRILTNVVRLEKINTWKSIVIEETNMFLFVGSLNECQKNLKGSSIKPCDSVLSLFM